MTWFVPVVTVLLVTAWLWQEDRRREAEQKQRVQPAYARQTPVEKKTARWL